MRRWRNLVARRGKRRSRSFWLWRNRYARYSILVLLLLFAGHVFYLDVQIKEQWEAKKYADAAYVYARPLELYTSIALNQKELLYEVNRLGYRLVEKPAAPGQYSYDEQGVTLYSRAFVHFDQEEPAKQVRIVFRAGAVAEMRLIATNEELPLFRLDPVLIGKIYPAHNEDRILVKLKEVPERLVKILKAVEDRNFDSHWGITIKGLVRATWANLRAGKTVQGGSTLTQQLVKNYFLSNQRTYARKINEMIMAVLLEARYKKRDILEAYINEVYLGQDGSRAVHGFGLASYFYFNRPLHELELHQMALLVGMVKGASLYDPRRNPNNARQRRDVVLSVLVEEKAITKDEAFAAKQKPLDVVEKKREGFTEYPAFTDILRRQLRRDYREEDLTTGGLKIFTTLDPIVQYYAEKALEKQIVALEKAHKIETGKLQGAVVITTTNQGEVRAVIGNRDPRYPGFNRALDTNRPIGSLIKPVVYLTALQSDKYTLATLLDDSPLEHKDGPNIWKPFNYDKTNHGMVPLFESLAHSYNITTARLGLDIGVDKVLETMAKMGVEKKFSPLPSRLLGTMELSPMEVAQMYQTFAGKGFNTKLRVVREIMNTKGQRLKAYYTDIEKVVDSESVYQLNSVLQYAILAGTGRGMKQFLPKELGVAGKTGTTDDTRDAWFAGYTGNYLGVVWLGRDDNEPLGFTGATGSLRVWGELMSHINPTALKLEPPTDSKRQFKFFWIDPKSGNAVSGECEGAVQLPFLVNEAKPLPEQSSSCTGGSKSWKLFR